MSGIGSNRVAKKKAASGLLPALPHMEEE